MTSIASACRRVSTGVAMAVTAAAVLTAPVPANADVVATRITAPADPAFHLPDVGVDADVNVRGVATVVAPRAAPEQVDLFCYANNDGVSGRELLATVAVDIDGAFEVDDVSLPWGASRMCRLRAVPHVDDPVTIRDENDPLGSALGAFRGVRVGIGEVDPLSLTERFGLALFDPAFRIAGLLGDELAGFDVTTQQPAGSWTFSSLSEAGGQDGKLYHGTNFTEIDASVFDGAATLQRTTSSGRTSLLVDERIGYTAASAADWTGVVQGTSPLRVAERRVDGAAGDVAFAEAHAVTRCEDDHDDPEDAPDFDPAPTGFCHHLSPTGVSVQRRYETSADGRQLEITDRFTSTDGAEHRLTARYGNRLTGVAPRLGFGQGPLSVRDRYSHVSFDRSPASIVIDQEAALPDGHADVAAGAVTYASSPDLVSFESPTAYVAEYERVVPRTGELVLTHVLSQAHTLGEARDLASAAERRHTDVPSTAVPESAVVTPVRDGQTAAAPPQAPAAAPLPQRRAPCTLPRLERRLASSALGAIVRAGCTIGRVTFRRTRKLAPFRIIRQGVQRGSVVEAGTPIDLVVSRAPRRAKTSSRTSRRSPARARHGRGRGRAR